MREESFKHVYWAHEYGGEGGGECGGGGGGEGGGDSVCKGGEVEKMV